MEITRGKIQAAQKVVVYGPEGIGKSTFASQFPEPLFIDTEGSTTHMDVARLPKPSSWTMLLEEVRYVINTPSLCKTLVIDTADWAETLCISEICARNHWSGIEDPGYGKGYVYLADEFGKLLNLLSEDVYKRQEYRYATESPREFLMLEEAPYRPRYERLASAGTGQYVFDDIPPEMVQIPEEFIDSDFVIGVNGDSMEPTYHDYDDLIVKKQLKVNDGEIGIFMIDGEAFVKEFRGDRLHSHNPEYDDIMLNEYMDIRCIGKVIGKR